ncbi:hypothetical protein [Fulvimarina sp. MAC8]|uniref:hypothetical protein n=1 Tax=Fulvimarina sp. MAC8 TaxID=3162874 RepID=UPI0032EC3C04
MFNRPNASASGTRKMIVAILAGAFLSTTALTASRAQNTEPAQTPPAASEEASPSSTDRGRSAGEGDRSADRMERRAERRGGYHHGKRGGHHRHGGMGEMMTPARVATALAALETGIGITPDQMEVWREFSSAAVAFAIAAQPGFGPRGERSVGPSDDADETEAANQSDEVMSDNPDTIASDDTPDASASATSENRAERTGRTPFDFIDRIAERAIASGEAAERLQTASGDLQEALTPEQVEIATSLVRSMMHEARSERGGRHGMRGHRRHHGEQGGHHRRHGERG